jgi:hypothetical protein
MPKAIEEVQAGFRKAYPWSYFKDGYCTQHAAQSCLKCISDYPISANRGPETLEEWNRRTANWNQGE